MYSVGERERLRLKEREEEIEREETEVGHRKQLRSSHFTKFL